MKTKSLLLTDVELLFFVEDHKRITRLWMQISSILCPRSKFESTVKKKSVINIFA